MKAVLLVGVVSLLVLFFYLFKGSSDKVPKPQIAQQIKIDQLESILDLLKGNKLEYDFFGITSNGIDCIYFVNSDGRFNVEFEVMVREQQPFVEELKKYAAEKGFKIKESTYGNKPDYESSQTAPVYRIETNSDSKRSAEIGTEIMKNIFNAQESTLFDVVP